MSEYIKRESAIIAVTRATLPDKTADGVPIANGKRSVTDCIRRIKSIPSEDVQPVKNGKWLDLWVEDDEIIGGGFMIKQCSVCKEEMYYGEPRYCPDCGAKMDGET